MTALNQKNRRNGSEVYNSLLQEWPDGRQITFMKEKKTHLKKNGRPLCGVRGKKLKFVKPNADETPSCRRCLKVIEE